MPMKPQAPGEHRADDEADGSLAVEENADQHRQHDANDGDRLVLPGQVGRCAGLDGRCDLLHTGIARVLGKNPTAGPETVDHGNESTDKRQNERRVACHFLLLESLFRVEGVQRCRGTPAALLPRS
jgi:hypothetical protein